MDISRADFRTADLLFFGEVMDSESCFFLKVAIICLLSSPILVFAEVDFSTDVNQDTIQWGDPILFRVRMHYNRKDRVEILFENGFPKPFEIRNQLSPKTLEQNNGMIKKTQDYLLKIFESGKIEIPSLTLQYYTALGDTGRILAPPIPVFIRPLGDTLESSEPSIKDQKDIAVRVPLWIWITGALMLFATVCLIWFVRFHNRKNQPDLPLPQVNWLIEVEKVAQMKLLEKGEVKRFYFLLTEVLRRFLEARTGIEAMERTTFEIGRDLDQEFVGGEIFIELEKFLSEADLVKFAKVTPSKEAAAGAVDCVRYLVERIDANYSKMSEDQMVHKNSEETVR